MCQRYREAVATPPNKAMQPWGTHFARAPRLIACTLGRLALMRTVMDTPEFDRFLFRGGDDIATVTTGRARIERRPLGSVDLPDGRVYACDPLVPMDMAPFAQRVEPGVYEAVLFVAVRTDPDVEGLFLAAERNVAAALAIGTEIPVSWRRATREGGEPDSGPYGVDSGTGCITGSRAAESLFANNEAAGAEIVETLKQVAGAVVALDGGAAAVFGAGDGDGVYETWCGYDADGAIPMILTDFANLKSAAMVTVVHAKWAKSAAKRWWQFWK